MVYRHSWGPISWEVGQDPKFPSRRLSKASHCLRWLASFVVFPGSDAHAPGHPHDVKENAIQESSIGPCFRHWTGPWLAFGYAAPLGDKLWWTVYSVTFLSELFTFWGEDLSYSSSSVRSAHTGQPSIPMCISLPWLPTTLPLFAIVPSSDHHKPDKLH